MSFKESQFTATKFTTATQKAMFANQFVKFVQNNFQWSDFPKWFYVQLSNCRGHIAHYNREGFFADWFTKPADKVRFIEHWLKHPFYGDPKFTFSDVETVLVNWLSAGEWLAKQEAVMQEELRAIKRAADTDPLAGQTYLEFKVASKSENTNSFGLHGYIMVARNGMVFEVCRSCTFPWTKGEVVKVPLTSDLQDNGQRRMQVAWEDVECPRQLKVAPKSVIDQIWA